MKQTTLFCEARRRGTRDPSRQCKARRRGTRDPSRQGLYLERLQQSVGQRLSSHYTCTCLLKARVLPGMTMRRALQLLRPTLMLYSVYTRRIGPVAVHRRLIDEAEPAEADYEEGGNEYDSSRIEDRPRKQIELIAQGL
eukprot:478171-Amphidinium_carterae.12